MGSQTKSILKNTASYMASSVIEGIVGFIISLVIARYLQDIGLGKYSFAFSFVTVFAIFADLGLESLMIREIARNKELTKKYLNNIFTLKVLLGIVFIVILPILIFFITKKDIAMLPIVALASLALLFDRLRYVFNSVFTAYERVELSLIVGVVERSLALILVFIFIQSFGLVGVVVALACSYFVSYAVSSYLTKRIFIKYSFSFDVSFWKEMLKNSWPFWFSSLFMIIYYKTDALMLFYMKGYQEVGWYSASYNLVFALTFIPAAVITAVYPVMSKYYKSEYYKNSDNLLKDLFEKCFRYLTMLALPIIGGTILFSDRIIPFIYKESFFPSVLVLKILILTIFFLFVNYLMGYLFNSINKQTYFTITTAICALVNVVLNFFLISEWSLYGAAIATVITEGINFAVLSYFCARWNFSLNLLKMIWKPIFAVGGMLIVGYYLSQLELYILVPIEALVYFILLILLKGVGMKELSLLKVLFNVK